MLGAAAAASPCPPASGLTTPNGTSRLDIDPLIGCLLSTACIVTHATSGLIIGLLLFLVAVGLTLIFGVLKIVNFAHGAFYMLGA